MTSSSSPLRFLARLSPEDARTLEKGRFANGLELSLERLRQPSGRRKPSAGSHWYLLGISGDRGRGWKGMGEWQCAHDLLAALAQVQIHPLEIEPDLTQQMPFTREPRRLTGGRLARGDDTAERRTRWALPGEKSMAAWHLDDQHSGLASARRGLDDACRHLTIAHLDTGYDPDHPTVPKYLDSGRARNFGPGARQSASDDACCPDDPTCTGHGIGTLALLAAGRVPAAIIHGAAQPESIVLGGAPGANVVPVKVGWGANYFSTASLARGLYHAADIEADVAFVGLGGLPSGAWADALNACYERGVVVVAAAGNSLNTHPMGQMVWPARFARAIAACGCMHDLAPYADLGPGILGGNFGPYSGMETAMSGFAPNVPWAVRGGAVVLNGAGTGAAAAQIAAAALLWLARHGDACRELGLTGWRRVEAVRSALFASCGREAGSNPSVRLGNGYLQAHRALEIGPLPPDAYVETPAARVAWPLFASLRSGPETAEGQAQIKLLRLELVHVAAQSAAVAAVASDLEAASASDFRRIAEALLDTDAISPQLRRWLAGATSVSGFMPSAPLSGKPETSREGFDDSGPAGIVPSRPAREIYVVPVPQPPVSRRLRIFSGDPSDAVVMASAATAVTTVPVQWEPRKVSRRLKPGPVGEYVEVVDVDPASRCFYPPVDLEDRLLLAEDGLAPSVGNPRFHQQMVYAVSMRTIETFERVLGRPALWAAEPRYYRKPFYTNLDEKDERRLYMGFVRRLRIYPHALRGANAFYSPEKIALLFGYFRGKRQGPDGVEPGDNTVFTCLSHDIIAHETTHALLDGVHRRLREASNPDVPAFHEAFADIVAIFQHFALPDVLRDEIRQARGVLTRTKLGELAREFGRGRGGPGALRDAINWPPETRNYRTAKEAHDLGAVLVAAVFDAFIRIYDARVAKILLVATGGTGIPAPGELHPALVDLLAEQARKAAEHVLEINIRAIDYLPPVDITFSDYLRAIVTADSDLVPADERGYRVAVIEAFARRYIFPDDVRSNTTEELRWRGPDQSIKGLGAFIRGLPLNWARDIDRLEAYAASRRCAQLLHEWIRANVGVEGGRQLGLDLSHRRGAKAEEAGEAAGLEDTMFEVHSVRPASRVMPDGGIRRDIVVVITQKQEEPIRPAEPGFGTFKFRFGSTLIVDVDGSRDDDPIRYIIAKRPYSKIRLKRARAYLEALRSGRTGIYFDRSEAAYAEPFAMLHDDEP